MIDRHYFEEHWRRQCEQLGSARLVVTLHGGKSFEVESIDLVLDGYVLLVVFPEEGVDQETKATRQKPGRDEIYWDRVAIPYETISYIWVSLGEPASANRIGFS